MSELQALASCSSLHIFVFCALYFAVFHIYILAQAYTEYTERLMTSVRSICFSKEFCLILRQDNPLLRIRFDDENRWSGSVLVRLESKDCGNAEGNQGRGVSKAEGSAKVRHSVSLQVRSMPYTRLSRFLLRLFLLVLSTCTASADPSTTMSIQKLPPLADLVIVGGGLSGLTALHQLLTLLREDGRRPQRILLAGTLHDIVLALGIVVEDEKSRREERKRRRI